MIIKLIEAVYGFLWGDLITIPLPGGGGLGLSLLVLLLIPTGIYFTLRTRFLPIRMFPDMIHAMTEKKERDGSAISTFQALVVSYTQIPYFQHDVAHGVLLIDPYRADFLAHHLPGQLLGRGLLL